MTEILDRFSRYARERITKKIGTISSDERHYQNGQFLYNKYSTIAKIAARQIIFVSQPSNAGLQIS